jgi:amidase
MKRRFEGRLSMPYRTASDLLGALRARDISSVDLVEAAIARIASLDEKLNAVVVRDFDRAMQAARSADEARGRGEDRPLLGLPVTVKEAFNIRGLPTTWGLPGTQDIPVAQDAVLIARLKAAGAVILGKTNVPVMLTDWQTGNPVYGVTNNPWDVSRTPGGSSGGGAAALAAGMVPLEFGSDMAGSLRIPASFCGVFSHRPSYGLVPMRGFAPPGAPVQSVGAPVDLAVVGPMARSAEDLMLALDVIAGPDDAEAVGYRLDMPPPRHRSLKDFRVLMLDDDPLAPTDAQVRKAHVELYGHLEVAGCTVARQSPLLPDLQSSAHNFVELLMAFSGADMPEKNYAEAVVAAERSRPDTGGLESAGKRALVMSHRNWVHADRRRFQLAHRWRQVFAEWDVILCPAAPCVAFPHDQRPFDQRTVTIDGYPMPYNLLPMWVSLSTPTGQPATVMPIGRNSDGLPIGMQIIGPYLEDRTSIAFAALVAKAFGGFVAPPN